MKTVLTLLVIILMVSTTAYAQRVTDFTIEPDDIQIRFPGAAATDEDQWHSPVMIGATTYSTLPLRPHKDKIKLGLQYWELELQEGMVVFEKGQVVIEVNQMPRGFRIMEFRGRVTTIDSLGNIIKGPWSIPSDLLQIIGKPGKAFQTG